MRIDPKTGEVALADGAILCRPRLSKTAFLGSAFGQTARLELVNEQFATYCAPVRSGADNFSLAFSFRGDAISALNLQIMDEGSTWADWSAEKESQRRQRHDRLLAESLGPPPYTFRWGAVTSDYDPRSGSS